MFSMRTQIGPIHRVTLYSVWSIGIVAFINPKVDGGQSNGVKKRCYVIDVSNSIVVRGTKCLEKFYIMYSHP